MLITMCDIRASRTIEPAPAGYTSIADRGVKHPQFLQPGFHGGVERVIRGAHIGELGVGAHGRGMIINSL